MLQLISSNKMEVVKPISPFTRMNSTCSADDSSIDMIEEELEVLEAIYIHELKVIHDESNRPQTIQLLLHPATEDDHEKQYVCLTLIFEPSPEYPLVPPVIKIRNPRGLADDEVENLSRRLDEHAEAIRGRPMLFELIEISKEVLTDRNIPHCPCVICQEHFTEDDAIARTECYHYFHPPCLSRYIKFSLEEGDDQQTIITLYTEKEEKKVVCPVCREVITFDTEDVDQQILAAEEQILYKPDKEMQTLQKKMSTLFQEQKAKGAIIDVEAEKNKFLIPADGLVYGLQPLQNNDKNERPGSEPKQPSEDHQATKTSSSKHSSSDVPRERNDSKIQFIKSKKDTERFENRPNRQRRQEERTFSSRNDYRETSRKSGKFSEKSGKFSDYDSGKFSDKSRKFSDESGKFSERSGKFSDESGKFSDKSRKFSDESGKFSERSGKFSDQNGKFSDKRGKFSDQNGRFSDSSGKFSDASGKFSDATGKFSDSSDSDFKSGANKTGRVGSGKGYRHDRGLDNQNHENELENGFRRSSGGKGQPHSLGNSSESLGSGRDVRGGRGKGRYADHSEGRGRAARNHRADMEFYKAGQRQDAGHRVDNREECRDAGRPGSAGVLEERAGSARGRGRKFSEGSGVLDERVGSARGRGRKFCEGSGLLEERAGSARGRGRKFSEGSQDFSAGVSQQDDGKERANVRYGNGNYERNSGRAGEFRDSRSRNFDGRNSGHDREAFRDNQNGYGSGGKTTDSYCKSKLGDESLGQQDGRPRGRGWGRSRGRYGQRQGDLESSRRAGENHDQHGARDVRGKSDASCNGTQSIESRESNEDNRGSYKASHYRGRGRRDRGRGRGREGQGNTADKTSTKVDTLS